MADVQFKRASKDDVQRLAVLSDTVFRSNLHPGSGMGYEFGLTFSASNAENLYFAEVDGQAVSLVAIQPGHVVLRGAKVSAIAMGSVCTLPEYRKHHYVSQLIQQILNDFSPTTSILLVSGGLSIYRRIDCVDFGARTEWTVARDWIARYESSVRVVPFHPALHPTQALTDLYLAEPYHYERSVEDFSFLLSVLQTPMFRARPLSPRTFVAMEGNNIVGYAVAQPKQEDGKFSVEVLEWAGKRGAVIDLAATILRWFQAPQLSLFGQLDDEALITALATTGAEAREVPNQGTVRVLNPALFVSEADAEIRQMYGASLSLESVEADTWRTVWSVAGEAASGGEARAALDAGAKDKDSSRQDGRPCATLKGYGELSTWLFQPSGLGISLPHTDDLNYV